MESFIFFFGGLLWIYTCFACQERERERESKGEKETMYLAGTIIYSFKFPHSQNTHPTAKVNMPMGLGCRAKGSGYPWQWTLRYSSPHDKTWKVAFWALPIGG